MIKTTPIKPIKAVFVIDIVALLYIFVYWPMATHQYHNLRLAENQAKILREKLKDDTRFQKVKFGQYTDSGGCFSVVGDVQTEDDIRFLTNFVESIPCPVKTYYHLTASNGFVDFQWMDKQDRAPQWAR
ncbi:MAG: hypothetical protein WBN75_16255 [Verrucomicrobiia bacterium]